MKILSANQGAKGHETQIGLIIAALVGCALIVGFAGLQASAQPAMNEAASQPLKPQSVLGDGTPGSCTEAAFATAFLAGGNITFNCGKRRSRSR